MLMIRRSILIAILEKNCVDERSIGEEQLHLFLALRLLNCQERSVSIILELKTAEWTLRVRANKNENRLETLKKTLAARELHLPGSQILFSPPVTILLNEEAGTPEFPQSQLRLPEPVFFENKQYQFTITFSSKFKSDTAPIVKHRLRNIEEAFFFDEDSRILSGSIDFSNNVGWFRLGFGYRKDGIEKIQYVSFEVLPVKMAMEQDLAKIHKTIDSKYPLWRFSFAKQTDQELARSKQEYDHFPLLWLAHFAKLRGRLPSKLEERVKEHIDNKDDHHRYLIRSRHLSTDTPENRFIKMALSHCQKEIGHIIDIAKKNQPAPDEGRLSDSFFEELENWKKPLEQLLNQSFFSDIGRYEGMERESLVLHQRAGYSQVYRIWQQLKMYLDLFGNGAAISMKSVADLYEVWCFLAIKEILESLGLQEQSSTMSGLSKHTLEMKMENGKNSAFHLYREIDQLHVSLCHEPKFGNFKKDKTGDIYSWTTEQKPDIFLEARFGDGPTLRWIFDAKYRIDEKTGEDRAPDDAINQMHRYRDAIIHIDKKLYGQNAKSRPVLGAFVLYPGWFEKDIKTNPYHDSIEEVGIGAFPLLPGHSNHWLRAFLEKQFGTKAAVIPYPDSLQVSRSDRYLIEDSVSIPVTGTYLGQYRDLTLCANLGHLEGRTEEYTNAYKTGTADWYHVPVSTTLLKSISHRVMKETRYCAIAVQIVDSDGKHLREIAYLYEVLEIKICTRSALNLKQTGKELAADGDYWLLKLGQVTPISHPVRFDDNGRFMIFHTSADALRQGEIFEKLPHYYPNMIYDAAN